MEQVLSKNGNVHGVFSFFIRRRKQEGAFPLLCCLSPLCGESITCQTHQLSFFISQPASPRRQKQHSQKATITSFHWSVCVRCALLHSDCTGPKVQHTELLLVQEMALQTGEDSMFPERWGPLAVLRVFLFFRPETVSENSWGFPKPYSSGGKASSDIISE